jgi:hypothetical protein
VPAFCAPQAREVHQAINPKNRRGPRPIDVTNVAASRRFEKEYVAHV